MFPPADTAGEHGVVCVGGDLALDTLLAAYSSGLFPMPAGVCLPEREIGPVRPGPATPADDAAEAAPAPASTLGRSQGPIIWWSPDPRGVLELGDLIVHRSLRRSRRRYTIRVDTAFKSVIDACADPGRPHGWIDRRMHEAYSALHETGFCHSVEAWLGDSLAGGLYGVSIGGLFAGESMFHRARDASKAALAALVEMLDDGHDRLIDVQWPTRHLRSLGATAIPRDDYLRRLPALLRSPRPTLTARSRPFSETPPTCPAALEAYGNRECRSPPNRQHQPA